MKEFRILSPTAILGYGFPAASFEAGMRLKPHAIAVDAGSTDPGPYYLGSGKSFTDRGAVKRDLEFMLEAACCEGIPLLIGSAGGAGADSHLEWNVNIIKEIAREKGLSFKAAIISSQIAPEVVLASFEAGKLKAMPPAPAPTEQDIKQSANIVAQMGEEPFIA
ncbi:MAG: 3-methylaspartate ammonia-lyase, partial [Clostridiales bacterium]|nr:3-methylaspartate ammonia-lyase [Clostridiales bacterium]